VAIASIAPTTSTANATDPIPMPAFAPVDMELGGIVEAGLEVEVDVMLLVLVIVLLPVTEAEELVAEPNDFLGRATAVCVLVTAAPSC